MSTISIRCENPMLCDLFESLGKLLNFAMKQAELYERPIVAGVFDLKTFLGQFEKSDDQDECQSNHLYFQLMISMINAMSANFGQITLFQTVVFLREICTKCMMRSGHFIDQDLNAIEISAVQQFVELVDAAYRQVKNGDFLFDNLEKLKIEFDAKTGKFSVPQGVKLAAASSADFAGLF